MNNSKILVVIPTYNCEKQIIRVLDEFTPELLSELTKVIIIDNKSTDSTKEIVLSKIKEKSWDKVRIYENQENYCLGGSQKLGFKTAINEDYDYVIILHGDNQAKSIEILKLIDEVNIDSSVEIVYGSRFLSDSVLVGYSFVRIFGNKIINSLYSLITSRQVKDLGSGLNLFKVSALKKINYNDCSDQLHFNMDLLLEIFRKNISIKYIPITWREEDQVSNAKIFNIGYESIKSLFKWKLGFKNSTNEIVYNTTEYKKGIN